MLMCILWQYNRERHYSFTTTPVTPTVRTNTMTALTPTLYRVTRVTDGDTISIDYNGKETTVRLIGLDTPEKWTLKTGFEECYGKEASDYAHTFFKDRKVQIQFDSTQARTDKYWRLLAHVFLEDGTYYEETALRKGYWFYLMFNKPSMHSTKLVAAEEFARKSNIGVWKNCGGLLKKVSNQ